MMDETTSGPESISDAQVDDLYNAIENPSQTEALPETQVEASPATQTPQEFEITWKGKQIKIPADKAKIYAQQGYNYAQQMQAFNLEKTKWDQRLKDYEANSQKYSQYSQIDEFAKKNPQWWSHVTSQYQAAIAGNTPQGQPTQMDPQISQLMSKVGEFEQFKTNFEKETQARQRSEQDQALDKEILSIRESYSNLDWDSLDDNGKTLEMNILEHASKNGINSYRAAFRDFYHDHLVKLEREKAKEDVIKERKTQTKLGLLGKSPTPRTGITSVENVKNKTYSQLWEEGLKELGFTG